jgi:hypothetical protein
MAQIDPDLQRHYGFMIGSIPESIRKALDSEELKDRLVMAEELIRKSQAARTPADRKSLGEQAQRVLGARPRAETEQIVVAKMAKARALGSTSQAEALVQQARDLLLQEPPAVRRRDSRGVPIAKASAKPGPGPSGLIALYDAAGNMIYACPENSPDLIPIVPVDKANVAAKGR